MLQEWYVAHCDDDWEHSFGIKIDTLDNPGWRITIDLEGTPLEGIPFKETKMDYDSETNWLLCNVENNKFVGACGPMLLENMVSIFLEWAHST